MAEAFELRRMSERLMDQIEVDSTTTESLSPTFCMAIGSVALSSLKELLEINVLGRLVSNGKQLSYLVCGQKSLECLKVELEC